ncbi:MAG TPA: hypothetical protein VEC15_00275 [Actinomycetota bacterium]|nr:hypothetical protein [Actinomycetota bacterium]
MNGVAKQFWSEVLDLHTPVTDDDRGRKSARRAKKPARRTLTNQARRRPAA